MVPGGIELLADPTVQQLAGIERQQPLPGFDLIIRPTLQFYPGTVPVVELGFPACHEHALVPLPTLGYRGAAALCQRLLSAAMRPRVEGRRLPPRPLAGEHP